MLADVSGLDESCRAYLGRRLVLYFEEGWGWTRQQWGDAVPLPPAILSRITSAEVVVERFLSAGPITLRGFQGRICSSSFFPERWPVVALTMADGLAHRFSDTPPMPWRFYLGAGELQVNEEQRRFHVEGEGVYGGYGRVGEIRCDLREQGKMG